MGRISLRIHRDPEQPKSLGVRASAQMLEQLKWYEFFVVVLTV